MIDVASDKLISQAEVCSRFDISGESFRNWRIRGLECVKMGKTWYTTSDALNAFGQRNNPPQPVLSNRIDQDAHEAAMRELNSA